MKTFNLEEALAGKPVVTRNGKAVTKLTLFPVNGDYPLVGAVEGEYEPQTFTTTGKFRIGDMERPFDLIMASTKKTGYINVYAGEVFEHTFLNKTVFHEQPQAPNRLGKTIHPTQKAADDQQVPNRIGVAVITWEE